MTNYNKRLDEMLSKTPCAQCDGSGAYPDYDGEPLQCQFCWQLRFTFIDKAKQAITSLIKELVTEAKPYRGTVIDKWNKDRVDEVKATNAAMNAWADIYEQNLLKALERGSEDAK